MSHHMTGIKETNRCIGLMGWIFGHKFDDWTNSGPLYSFCKRCGIKHA